MTKPSNAKHEPSEDPFRTLWTACNDEARSECRRHHQEHQEARQHAGSVRCTAYDATRHAARRERDVAESSRRWPLGHHVELRPARRGRRHEPQRIPVIGFDVDAVESARVQMHVEIQARTKALHERDGARMKLAGLTSLLRVALVVTRELFGVDAPTST